VITISNETIFWTQVASIIAFVVALFVLYRLLVDQKDATIQLQKENILYLKDQLEDAKAQSPDLLAQSLTNRVNLLEGELRRLEQDKTATQDQISAKEEELAATRTEAEALTRQVVHARSLLKDFLCPSCGAPLAEKAYHYESVEYKGRELDVDHEYVIFECGYERVDGKVRGVCGGTKI
jgi:DNA repair exonuclease SbcCD ATPase subunit